MTTTHKQRPLRLRRARSYFQLAAKADRAGQHTVGNHYRSLAERLVTEERRERERRQARKGH